MKKYCNIKKGDKVLINNGKFSKTISIVSKVVCFKENKDENSWFFKIALSDLPKKTVKQKKTGAIKQVDTLIHSSNVELIESKE